jgi:hypothetical protein
MPQFYFQVYTNQLCLPVSSHNHQHHRGGGNIGHVWTYTNQMNQKHTYIHHIHTYIHTYIIQTCPILEAVKVCPGLWSCPPPKLICSPEVILPLAFDAAGDLSKLSRFKSKVGGVYTGMLCALVCVCFCVGM